MRFGPTQQGGVNADVFIEFLKRLIAGAKHEIFLFVDRGLAHIARKTRAFVETLNGSLRLFHLPPYSPDRNPDELVWSELQKHMIPTAFRARPDDMESCDRKGRSSKSNSWSMS